MDWCLVIRMPHFRYQRRVNCFEKNHISLTLILTSINLTRHFNVSVIGVIIIPSPNEVGGGILDSPCPSIRPSVRPSICRRHGFRSISQVCFEISISNFICMLMGAIGRSLLIFSDITFKMAAWQPYWIFWFPNSNFSFALNISSKLQWHNTYEYEPIDFQWHHFQNGRLVAILIFQFLDCVGSMVSRA